MRTVTRDARLCRRTFTSASCTIAVTSRHSSGGSVRVSGTPIQIRLDGRIAREALHQVGQFVRQAPGVHIRLSKLLHHLARSNGFVVQKVAHLEQLAGERRIDGVGAAPDRLEAHLESGERLNDAVVQLRGKARAPARFDACAQAAKQVEIQQHRDNTPHEGLEKPEPEVPARRPFGVEDVRTR